MFTFCLYVHRRRILSLSLFFVPNVLLRTLSLSLSLFFVYFFFCLLFVPALCGESVRFPSSLPAGAASDAGPAAASAAGGGAFSSLNSMSLMRLNAFVSSSIMLNPPLKMVKNPPLTFNSPFAILSCTNGNVFTFSTLRRTFSCSNCLNRSSLSYSAQTCFTLSLINPHHASTYPLPSSLLLLLLFFFSSSSFDVVVVAAAGGENKLNACAHPPHCACPKTTIASTFSDFTAYSIAAHVPWCAVSAFLSSFFTNGGTTFATFRMVKISPGSALKTSVGSYLLSQH